MLVTENVRCEVYTDLSVSEYKLRALYILLNIQCIEASFSLYQSKQDWKQPFRGEKFSVSCRELLNYPVHLHSGLVFFFFLLKSLNVEVFFLESFFLNIFKHHLIFSSLECRCSIVIFINMRFQSYVWYLYWKVNKRFVCMVSASRCLVAIYICFKVKKLF